jgi:V/A-type H+-transporting ATPase subunit D
MERLPVSVNKSNLLRLKEELVFARDALELLDEKKQVLTAHISTLSTKAARVRAKLNAILERSYGYLQEAIIIHGGLNCEKASMACRLDEEVEMRERVFMGVTLPILRIRHPPLAPSYGFQGTGITMDLVAKNIHSGLETMVELAEIEVALFRLVTELKKTIRRINALENVYIPVYESTVKHIEDGLEEREREFLFQLKRCKKSREEAVYESF